MNSYEILVAYACGLTVIPANLSFSGLVVLEKIFKQPHPIFAFS
jgi:hypothetical protein